jgi:hypothetical protein
LSKYDVLDSTQLAHHWISSRGTETHYDINEYVVSLDFMEQSLRRLAFLAALVNLAEHDDEIGAVAAGPIEAAIESDLDLAMDLERVCDPSRLARVLSRMWTYDASPDVISWRATLLARASQ